MSKKMADKWEWRTSIVENLKFQIQYKYFKVFVFWDKQQPNSRQPERRLTTEGKGLGRRKWRQTAVADEDRIVEAVVLGFYLRERVHNSTKRILMF